MEKRKSIREAISADSGYEIALMTSFTFDVPFFERAILNPLIYKGVKTISVFADARQFTSALSEIHTSEIGRRYLVVPVEIDGSFHPKVILLLGKDKAKLIVSSANLTTSGHFINNEVFNCISYSKEEPEYQDVIVSAMQFFIKLKQYSYPIDNEVIDRIREFPYYRRASENGSIRFIHNIDQPLITQIKQLIDEPVTTIQIAVPYYDRSLAALKQIGEAFSEAKVELFIQNKFSTFPISCNEKESVVSGISVFERFSDNGSSKFYHGKVFVFKTPEAAYILYGSANCTQAALTNSLNEGGNAEADLFAKGLRNEFDYYFENFVLSDEPLTVSDPVFSIDSNSFCYYKYGLLNNNNLYLHFGSAEDCEIYLADEKLNCTIEGGDLVAVVPEDHIYELPALFNVVAKNSNLTKEVKCWWYNPDYLESFRARENSANEIKNIELESSGDKYLQDRINLLNAEMDCLSDIENVNRANAAITQIKAIETETSEEDFFVDYEIPEEYIHSYKAQNAIAEVRQLFIERTINYYKPVFSNTGAKIAASSNDSDVSDDIMTIKMRQPTSDEKAFERFVRRRIGIITDPENENIEKIAPMHLFGLVQEFLDIFDKYKYVELFDSVYVADSRVKLFYTLLKKDFSEEEDTKRYVVLLECYKALVNNYYLALRERELYHREKYDYCNKKLLDIMSENYEIRTSYRAHIQDLLKSEEGVLKASYLKDISNYLENLFGYKDKASLVDYIGSRYSCKEIVVGDSIVEIRATTNNTRHHGIPDKMVLKEIRNYSRNVNRIDKVIIVIDNIADTPIQRIEHSVNINNSSCSTQFIYKNGRELPPDIIKPFYF